MFNKLRLECSLVAVILVACTAFGQVTTGTPPFGSFGGGPFDTVNLGSLNVHFSIPIVNKAGRGIPFTYALSYDSSVWTQVTNNGITSWSPTANWGWKGDTEIATGYVSNNQSNFLCNPRLGLYKTTFSGFVYHDPFGTSHAMFGAAWIDDCHNTTRNLVGRALDGSGYTVYFYVDGIGTDQVTSRTGSVINPPFNVTSGAGKATDANGNQITTDGSGKFYDTLSGTAQVLTVAGTSPKTFTYTSPSGSKAYSLNYTAKNVWTSFGCSGIGEYQATNVSLVSSIGLPDGTQYAFTYETSTTHSGYITGRLASVQLPTGGTISFAHTGANGGINCTDGSTLGLNRTTSDSSTPWTYSRSGSGSAWTTTVTDPLTNATVINFEKDSSTTGPNNNFYETQRVVKQGSNTLSTTISCYNGVNVGAPSSCYNTAVASPISRTTAFHYLPTSSGSQAETDTTYDPNGLITEVDEYDYGVGAVGSLIRKTITAYNTSLGNGIVDRPASVTIKDVGNNVNAFTSYGYDETPPTATNGTPQHIGINGSRGLLTSIVAQANGTTNLYRKYTYYDTGTLSTSTDVSTSSTTNGAQTTYNYSATNNADCGNAFVTSITEPLGLSRSMTWDCNGGVMLSLTDENGKISSTAYSGPNYTNVLWRPYSTTDQAGTTTNYFYDLNSNNQPFQTESKYASTFNGGNSIVDVLTTTDGFGRTIFRQKKQGPSAANYSTVATCYDSLGRVILTTLPYSNAAITSTTTACPSGNAGTSSTYDALNRTTNISDSGGGSTAYTYYENDVLQALTSPTQTKQQEYDALGRLKSVCEITSGTTAFPGGTCPQNSSPQPTGYWTTYTYDVLGDLTGVMQNAQASSGHQTRAYAYDMLGRLTSETNPETNNASVSYSYDSLSSDTSCGTITSAGNKLKRMDAAGNGACYAGYDALHRVGNVTYPSTSTPAKHFIYDAATVNGTAMSNATTRLAEAYTCTGTCSSKITDLGFSYSATGQTSDVWELTPHSGTNVYYHVSSLYWPNGALNTLSNLSGLPTITYSVDGEGRPGTVSASSGQNPVTSITYNAASQVTALTFGSSDSDSFTFDPSTGRMTQYQFNMGSTPTTDTGVLTWNPNGSLLQLVITDHIVPVNTQTCTYTHDDLGRVASSNCGCSLWSQTFSYDPFGNITKTIPTGCTAMSFQVSYDYTNNTNRITSTPFAYNNNNGDLTADNNHAYAWDMENELTGIDTGTSSGVCITYDALGRAVEQGKGSSCVTSPTSATEIVYAPSGAKLALMNGSSLTKGFVSLPGGAQAVYNTSGLQFYRHPDWLGSSRLVSTTGRAKYYDVAYAPFGEPYAASGTKDLSFTGQNQDTESSTVPGGAGGLYDFLYRKHTPVQGRWLSPDPKGLGATNPADPQTWNRYAFVGNRPLNTVDSLGLVTTVCDPLDPFCVGGPIEPPPPPCDITVDLSCIPGPIFPPDPGPGGGGGSGPPGGGGPGGPPQRQGGVWPENETMGLPSLPNTQPLNLGNLLSFAPGLSCGDGSGLGFTTSTPVPGSNTCITLAITIALAIEAVSESSSSNNSSNNNPDSRCTARQLPGAGLLDWCADYGWVTVSGFDCTGNYSCCQAKRSVFDAGCLARNSYYDKKAGVQRYVLSTRT